jgi:Domain of unknown function (DUF4258)
MTLPDPDKNAVSAFRLTCSVAEKRIHETASITERIIWGEHALKRMDERGITDVQVLEILRTGMVVDQPAKTERDEWQCKIIKELRGKRKAGVVVIILHKGRLFLKTVEWEDIR